MFQDINLDHTIFHVLKTASGSTLNVVMMDAPKSGLYYMSPSPFITMEQTSVPSWVDQIPKPGI